MKWNKTSIVKKKIFGKKRIKHVQQLLYPVRCVFITHKQTVFSYHNNKHNTKDRIEKRSQTKTEFK